MTTRVISRVAASPRATGLVAALSLVMAVLAGGVAWADSGSGSSQETILFIRHGEKPKEGLGQLDCQGLNRSLALPGVMRRKYSRINAIFAPNPSQRKPDGKGDDDAKRETYDYVRPLATAEPTAIAFGLPIQAEIGFTDIAKLKAALLDPAYKNATVLVAWEHHQIFNLVPDLVTSLGGKDPKIEEWPNKDFDSIWRVTITRTGSSTSVDFAYDQEGLNGQPKTCPN